MNLFLMMTIRPLMWNILTQKGRIVENWTFPLVICHTVKMLHSTSKVVETPLLIVMVEDGDLIEIS